jgi:hypothetical protein
MKHYFGLKYNANHKQQSSKIIHMNKKTDRKHENDSMNETIEVKEKSFHSIRAKKTNNYKCNSIIVLNKHGTSTDTTPVNESKVIKENKPIKKLSKYVKIGGAVSSRVKVVSKPSSASRQENHNQNFMNQSNFLKQRRGSTMTSCSNSTSRY